MLIPIFGEFLSSAALVLNVYFKSWPMEAAGVAEALFEGITGKLQKYFTFILYTQIN